MAGPDQPPRTGKPPRGAGPPPRGAGEPPRASVEQRIGQVIWPALRASRGEAGIEALSPLLDAYPPGGVILFGEGMERVDRLIARLRLRARGDLLVAADLERGCGQHVREFSSLPPAMAIAACPDKDAAHQAGLLTAIEARQAGIDVVFAPVADVNTAATNPIIATRSFGDDPHRVAALASAFAAGLREGGVLAVAKHFPGHGSTVQDSHSEIARVTRSLEELTRVDLLPFRTLIAERIGGVMVGHLEVPALDPVRGRPATRSPAVVLDLLRQQLGYDGLVVTDALDMGAFPREEACALDVLQSGLDVLLMPRDPLATARYLHDCHTRHFLPDEVLDAAVRRIAAAREAVRGGTSPRRTPRSPRRGASGKAIATDLPAALLQGSLTAAGRPFAPLVPGLPVDVAVFGDDGTGIVLPAFLEALAAAGVPTSPGADLGGGPGTGSGERPAPPRPRAPAGAPTPGPTRRIGLVLTSVRAWLGSSRLPELDRGRLDWALAHRQLDVVVVLGSPYELLALPAGQPALLAYEPSAAAAAQAVRVLLGEAAAPGRLPVGSPP